MPASEVEARLRQVEASDPEFQAVAASLRALNEQKAAFLAKITSNIEAITSAYARVASQLVGVGVMEHRLGEQLTTLDHEAALFARHLDQQARLVLVKYLYFVAKCYEYVVLEPVDVNYQIAQIFNKTVEQLKGRELNNQEFNNLLVIDEVASALQPVFKAELHKMRDRLISGFPKESTLSWSKRLSKEQTPAVIAALNAQGEAIVNLKDLDLISPRYERMRIESVEIENIGFDAATPQAGSVDLTIEPVGEGTLRAGSQLYAVQHPSLTHSDGAIGPAPLIWGVRYSFDRNALEARHPSKASMALLQELLGSATSFDDSMATPAAWTCMRIRYTRPVAAPGIASVSLTFTLSFADAGEEDCVLDVRMAGPEAPLVECTTDRNGRGAGYGDLYRFYPKTPGAQVEVCAPLQYGRKCFDYWELWKDAGNMGTSEISRQHRLRVETVSHVRLVCHYRDSAPASQETVTTADALAH